jgi:hypothetical protein
MNEITSGQGNKTAKESAENWKKWKWLSIDAVYFIGEVNKRSSA